LAGLLDAAAGVVYVVVSAATVPRHPSHRWRVKTVAGTFRFDFEWDPQAESPVLRGD